MASIVQRGNSYSVVYYKKENGIRKQEWESFRTIKDALHRKSMVEYSQQSKKELAHRPQTVEQLIQEYVWLYGRAKWSLSMYTSSRGLIQNYINPYFGSVRLDELTPRLVSKLYMEFQNSPRYCGPYHKYEGQSVSTSTLKSVHKLLHSALEQAVLWEYVGRNPFHKAVLPKTKATPSVFLSPEQIQLLLHHCSVSWLRLAIELSFVCTLRRGELLALTWDDINWEQNSLQISKTLCRVSKDAMLMLEGRDVLHVFPTEAHSKTVLVLKSPKTESSNRIVYLPPSLKCSLLEWQNEQKKSAIGELPRLIFAYEDNWPLQSGVLTKHFQGLLTKCNLPKVTFHSLRHSSITYKLVLTGGDIKAVQGDSDHSQADMITEIYEQLMGADKIEPQEKSIIDRSVGNIYREYLKNYQGEPPTLKNLYDDLMKQVNPEAHRIALALELFTMGSLNVFAHQTNINTKSRILCFDIQDLGENLKSVGLLVMLDAIYNRVIQNRKAGKFTHVYIDEIYLFFANGNGTSSNINNYSSEFLYRCWKRFRKSGARLTGITQNLSECLLSNTARQMLANSEFLLMLNQAATDREQLARLLGASETQMSYVDNAPAGHGLIRVGGAIVPFSNELPKNTELYRLMSTKPGED